MFIGSIFAYEGICLFHLFFLKIFERQYKNENLDKGNKKKIVSVVLFLFWKVLFSLWAKRSPFYNGWQSLWEQRTTNNFRKQRMKSQTSKRDKTTRKATKKKWKKKPHPVANCNLSYCLDIWRKKTPHIKQFLLRLSWRLPNWDIMGGGRFPCYSVK